MSSDDRRSEYRLHYPFDERPQITIEGAIYTIDELSEGGMKVYFMDDRTLPEYVPFTGNIRYIDGEEVEVTGIIKRSDKHGFSVQFEKGVSMQRIVTDQIRLKKKYPLLFDHVD